MMMQQRAGIKSRHAASFSKLTHHLLFSLIIIRVSYSPLLDQVKFLRMPLLLNHILYQLACFSYSLQNTEPIYYYTHASTHLLLSFSSKHTPYGVLGFWGFGVLGCFYFFSSVSHRSYPILFLSLSLSPSSLSFPFSLLRPLSLSFSPLWPLGPALGLL